MPIQVDSYSSAAQAAVNNPIAQRQDQVRIDQRREDDKEKTKTKPTGTAAAESQKSESRSGNVVKFSASESHSHESKNAPRGGLVNISV